MCGRRLQTTAGGLLEAPSNCRLNSHILRRDAARAALARIVIKRHQRTLKTIDKKGPLRNAADRDHCLQYAVAVALLKGVWRLSTIATRLLATLFRSAA